MTVHQLIANLCQLSQSADVVFADSARPGEPVSTLIVSREETRETTTDKVQLGFIRR